MSAAASDSNLPEDRCDSIRPLLSDFADRRTTGTESALVEEHVAGCPACTSRLAELRLMRQAIRAALPDMQPPGDLYARVAAATWQRPSLRDRIFGYLRPAPVRIALGSAMAFSIALAVFAPRLTGGGSQTPTLAEKSGENGKSGVSIASGPKKGTGLIAQTKPAPSPKPAVAPVIAPPAIEDSEPLRQVAVAHPAPVKPHISLVLPKKDTPPTIKQSPMDSQLVRNKANVQKAIDTLPISQEPVRNQVAINRITQPVLPSRHSDFVRLTAPSANKIDMPTTFATPGPVRIASAASVEHIDPDKINSSVETPHEEPKPYIPHMFTGKGVLNGLGTNPADQTIASKANAACLATPAGGLAVVKAPTSNE